MPGEVSRSYEGPSDDKPELPDWAFQQLRQRCEDRTKRIIEEAAKGRRLAPDAMSVVIARWLVDHPEKPRFTLTRQQLCNLLHEIDDLLETLDMVWNKGQA